MTRSLLSRSGLALLLFAAQLLLACSGESGPGCDARSCDPIDAGQPPGVGSERCDGLDDDGDGRIDEGCACAPDEVRSCWPGSSLPLGACRLGTMTCRSQPGSEFAQWGDSSCVGALLPQDERCDGSDADCDGTIDEGCDCTDGEERVCDGASVGACTASVQRCEGGAWGDCSEAVGPFEELCGDGVDGDCDGEIDDGCGCDGSDTCGPFGLDEPGFLDERPSGGYWRVRYAWMGGRVASVAAQTLGTGPRYDVAYSLVISEADGSTHRQTDPFVVAVHRVETGYDETVHELLWTGSELWVLVQRVVQTDRVRRHIAIRRFDPEGNALGEPFVLAGGVSGTATRPIGWIAGDRAHLAWAECDDADLYDSAAPEHQYAADALEGGCVRQRVMAQARDFSLRPLAEPLELHRTALLSNVELGRFALTDGTLGLSWTDRETTPLGAGVLLRFRTRLALIRDGEVIQHEFLIPMDGSGLREGHGSTTLAAGAGVFLACESVRFPTITCQRYDASGVALGARFEASAFDQKDALDIAWSGCHFVLATVGHMTEPPATYNRKSIRVERLDPATGARETVTTIDTDYNVEQTEEEGTFRELLDTNGAFVARRLWLEGPPLPRLITRVVRTYSTPTSRTLRRDLVRTFSCR